MCRCKTGPEDCFHFFYDCPFFNLPRMKLMYDLDKLGLSDLSLPILLDCEMYVERPLIPRVQDAVLTFIKSTKRF